MILLRLKRIANTYLGVFGVLEVCDGGRRAGAGTLVRVGHEVEVLYSCFTIERPWKDNIPRESCIPAGMYIMKRGWYNRGNYEVFEIVNVIGRSLIKLHKANVMTELLGCIAPGTRLSALGSQWAVLGSKHAFDQIMECLEGHDEARLIIYWEGNPE